MPPQLVELYVPLLLLAGGLVLLVAWLPLVLRKLPLSLPIICVLAGGAVFSLPVLQPYAPHPIENQWVVEKAAELIVIVSLMGAGLKIERVIGWRSWSLTWRLLAIAMPLTIVALTLLGHAMLGIGVATALLLAAALAPTDPVLASDVQIESAHSHEEDEARFALTSEAGLNDSLAFPFVHLAIALSLAGFSLGEWALDAVALRVTVGLALGWALGRLFGWVIYRMPKGTELSSTGDGFVALGATLATYALAELLHGYGFLAVFICGLTLRAFAREHEFNDRMHDFADETERLLMMAMLLLFGGMLVQGELLASAGWAELGFALAMLFLVRPIAAGISLIGVHRPPLERFIIAFFGIRGLGSVFYLAYGLNHGLFEAPVQLWATLGLVILISILLHGVTVTPLIRRLERQIARARPAPDQDA